MWALWEGTDQKASQWSPLSAFMPNNVTIGEQPTFLHGFSTEVFMASAVPTAIWRQFSSYIRWKQWNETLQLVARPTPPAAWVWVVLKEKLKDVKCKHGPEI